MARIRTHVNRVVPNRDLSKDALPTELLRQVKPSVRRGLTLLDSVAMGSLHRQVAVLVPDKKLNCFDFGKKKLFKTKRDYFHPGPVETPSG